MNRKPRVLNDWSTENATLSHYSQACVGWADVLGVVECAWFVHHRILLMHIGHHISLGILTHRWNEPRDLLDFIRSVSYGADQLQSSSGISRRCLSDRPQSEERSCVQA